MRHLSVPALLALLAVGAPVAATERLEPCDFGERNADAPEQLDQYAFLIGNWNIETTVRQQDGSWSDQVRRAYWEGRWILDGRAIADYWYDTPPTGEGPAPGRGVNVRMYRPEMGSSGQWTNMWQHSSLAEVRTLISEVRDDGLMHLWATHPDTSDARRMHFVAESDDFWYRVEERTFDQGANWIEVARIEARRAPCPWTPPSSSD